MGQMAGNLGNSNVMDPSQADWGDLDSGEKGSRLAGGAAKGLLKGFSNYQQENQALRQPTQAPMNPMQFAPPTPSSASQLGWQKPERNPFFYG